MSKYTPGTEEVEELVTLVRFIAESDGTPALHTAFCTTNACGKCFLCRCRAAVTKAEGAEK